MIKRLIYMVILVAVSATVQAQNYGNEWIDFNKQYYKIPVAEEGMYRITYADLQSAGFPVNAVDPRRLQLFHRGVEQAIYAPGQGNGVFESGEYIEFYGQKNDGTLDKKLYQPEAAQPHNYYNIYSDTTAYFLTYNLTPVTGKRMSLFSENNIGGLPAQAAHNQTDLNINTNQYSPGRSFNSRDVTQYTYFDYGEGWTGTMIQEGQQVNYSFSSIQNAVTSGAGNPKIEVLLTGRDNVTHVVEIFVGPNTATLRSLGTAQWSQYNSYTFQSDINWTDINSGSLTIQVRCLGFNGTNDRISTAYTKLIYPQTYNIQNANTKKLRLNTVVAGKAYIDLSNVPAAPHLYDITDPDDVRRIGFNTSGSTINAIVDGASSARTIWFNGNDYLTPVLSKVNFTNINAANYDYIIISNQVLRKPVGSVADPIQEYADYRASAEGGGFNPLVVNVDQLYNQFNYGETSALGVYNLMEYLVDNGDPKFLLLVGKGLSPSANFHRNVNGYFNVTKLGITYQIRDLVPSAGEPGADMAFTAGLGSSVYEPAVPVGRIPAVNPVQVLNYLNKVKETEALTYDALWKKKLLHLSGGFTVAELSLFRTYTNGFENIAEDDYLGGNVKTISKETNSSVELINVADEVNDGLNLITFFGHSAPSVTDIDIGFVTDPVLGYNNPGKYPGFLINGCNAGQFYNVNILFGEDWILAADKGAISFIANSSYGFSDRLRKYSDTFYATAYADSVFINKSIGEVQKEVALRYMDGAAETPTNITQIQQMVLLGDPAVRLFAANKPDFEINDDNVYAESFSDEPISAQLDSFAIKAIVRNFGRTTTDSLRVHVTRTLSDNSITEYDSIFPSVHFQDTLIFIIDNQIPNAAGNNQFTVEVDYFNEIDELEESNNIGTLNLFVPLFGTKNLFPVNYGIVSSQPVEIVVQASDLLSEQREYIIELDTSSTFNSPFKKQQIVQAKLLASWQTTLLSDVPANDSTVYYWRSKFSTPLEGESSEWVNSSFTYIKGSPNGWSQSQFPQLQHNLLEGLELNESGKRIEFESNTITAFVKTYGSSSGTGVSDVSLRLNGTEYIINNGYLCRNNTIAAVAFDKNTTVPYLAIGSSKGCGRQPQVINNFRFAELESGNDDLIEYIDNVNDGDSVIFFTIGNPSLASWSANVRSKLEEIGASAADLATLQNGEPMILAGKKGAAPGTATMFTTSATPKNEQELFTDLTVTGVFSSGNMSSTIVGPSVNWQSLQAFISSPDMPATDVNGIDVYGLTLDGNEMLLKSNLPMGVTSLTDINASQYPQLKLVLKTEDNDNLTAAQLVKWEVYYDGVPEGVLLLPDDAGTALEKAEGDSFESTYGFKNISTFSYADSVKVSYSLFNNATRTTTSYEKKIAAPEPGDTTRFNLDIPTLGQVGDNNYNLFVNPYDQPEQYYDNNIFNQSKYIKVIEDNINPLIDVAFDGQYILDGDIVSPTPLISIRLKDENQFLFKSDTSNMNIFLKRPCETCVFERIAFSSNQIEWYPADDKNEFNIEYKPSKLDDGIYTLRVDAEDASGNSSGTEPYQVNFEVINESSITHFYPYPNPFSSKTRFVFTLTGSEIPDQIKIQIMTVSGKVVREITQDELGAIHIGNNISDFSWDGRDEFGDQLANGVYLYRVLINQNGQAMEHRETSADKAFKHGFGKLYILR
ncbi:C25 family cysteine peptidase [Fulvivirga ligni]|uniref:putative type IX secretion system sortase PorU2 n=1 Tax=Fulvivirga ligni TaxID=2904246 RepID=UPI001F433125|nr:C25 family cysteine peptidase [Fulvivirga ligni]UII20187.1 C25 family cysteine peptidase [Fulvivirga ligni]